MTEERTERKSLDAGRYRYTEYHHESRTIAVIQDAENDRAWIQSTAVVPTDL